MIVTATFTYCAGFKLMVILYAEDKGNTGLCCHNMKMKQKRKLLIMNLTQESVDFKEDIYRTRRSVPYLR